MLLTFWSDSESSGRSVSPARYFSALLTSGPVTVVDSLSRAVVAGGLVEVGEGGEFADPGLLGGAAQLVAGAVLLGLALVLGLDGQAGEGVDLRFGRLPCGGRRARRAAARGWRRPVRWPGRARGGADRLGGTRRGAVREFLGEVVELGDDLGVRPVGLQRRALAADGVAAQRGDAGEVAAQDGGGRVPDLVHLLVDAGASAAR